jgi:hypothetical protein
VALAMLTDPMDEANGHVVSRRDHRAGGEQA